MTTVNIKGLDKAELLAALYNAAQPLGRGHLHANDATMSRDDAQALIETTDDRMYFDYVQGRPLKISLADDEMKTWLYDRDQGEGKAAEIVRSLRHEETI